MTNKEKTEGASVNPSYNQKFSIRERIADYLGKYYINLNGVTPNDNPEITNIHKREVVDFVNLISNQALAAQKEEFRVKIEKIDGKCPHVVGIKSQKDFDTGYIQCKADILTALDEK